VGGPGSRSPTWGSHRRPRRTQSRDGHASGCPRASILGGPSLPGERLEVPVEDRDVTHVRTAVAERGANARSTIVLVSRRESFNAAHQLRDPSLSDAENRRRYGKCANLHGHNYVLEVVVAGEIHPH